MASKGWTTPTWPEQYGGGALSTEESVVLKRINLNGLVANKGVTEWNGNEYDKEVEKCMRIWPHHNDTDGFFVARFEKC